MADEFFLIIPILGKVIPKMELKAVGLLENVSIALVVKDLLQNVVKT